MALCVAFKMLQEGLDCSLPDMALGDGHWAELGRLLVRFAQPAAALLPSPLWCNNPACINMEETAEWLLVSTGHGKCGSCCTARYCSLPCQRAHWEVHKPVCRALKAALADGSYVPGSSYVGISQLVQVD
jgi:MYND finger